MLCFHRILCPHLSNELKLGPEEPCYKSENNCKNQKRILRTTENSGESFTLT